VAGTPAASRTWSDWENSVKYRNSGVTLIELVVVVVIVAILASIAIPSYRDYVLRANRSAARAALLALATAQEKYYLECNSYVASLDPTQPNTCPGKTGSLSYPTTSENGYYTLTLAVTDGNFDAAGNPQSWTATATAASGQPQFRDTKCRAFELTSTGVKTAKNSGGTPNDNECWSK
jgi:type IV pilus assembly protein PilE